jgi:hypothetical protein
MYLIEKKLICIYYVLFQTSELYFGDMYELRLNSLINFRMYIVYSLKYNLEYFCFLGYEIG